MRMGAATFLVLAKLHRSLHIRRLYIAPFVALLGCAVSCTSSVKVFPGESLRPREEILAAVLPSGEEVLFDDEHGRLDVVTGTIIGRDVSGAPVSIALDETLYLRVRRFDTAETVIATVGVLSLATGSVIAIALATKESCPFVYAFDGTHYVLDAEPLGGTICRGMRRTDHGRLDRLRAVAPRRTDPPGEAPARSAGLEYRLLVRNEVEETQYLDEMTLLVFDHSPGVRIVADVGGGFHAVGRAQAPSRAADGDGRDLLAFLSSADGVCWQSHMPSCLSVPPDAPRHELTVSFPKPPHARSADLIVNAGSSLWGSNMIREMLALLGPQVPEWYRALAEQGPELDALNAFLHRDELYHLKVLVETGNGWSSRGVMRASGPLIVEDQVVTLDVADVPGDSLVLRLRPPFGFWSLDHMEVAYETRPAPRPAEISLLRAQDARGVDVTDLLRVADENYYTMLAVGDWAALTFPAPPRNGGEGPEAASERTVFLRATGYYEIQLPADLPARNEMVARLFAVPDACVDFAIETYRKLRADLRASADGAPEGAGEARTGGMQP